VRGGAKGRAYQNLFLIDLCPGTFYHGGEHKTTAYEEVLLVRGSSGGGWVFAPKGVGGK